MGRGCVSLFPACAVLVALLPIPVCAQDQRVDGGLFEAALPGGLPAALTALDDRTAADRSQFLLEIIRRLHDTPIVAQADPRLALLRSLVAHLEASSTSSSATEPRTSDTVPLPLPAATWIEVVFGGRATPETLVAAILQSRSASLLYCALLSLDDATRAWLATRRDLISDLASEGTAAFLVAAPGLRVRDGRLHLPGGEAAVPAWLALAGTSANEPAEFIRRVVEPERARLAYFLSAMAQMSAAQIAYALKLDSADPADRVAAARRLYEVFARVAPHWSIDRQPFWRPALDPALLLSGLRVDERGRPIVPGARDFWNNVFAESARGGRPRARKSGAADPVDFDWLCERVFAGMPVERERRYNIVLFASRNLERIAPDIQRDALEAVRAAWRYPALAADLERAGLTDVRAFAAAARRASTLGAIRDRTRANRALLQFQGALALIARAARRGGLPPDSFPLLVSSLSAVDVNREGDYQGRLVEWLAAHVMAPPETVPEAQLVRMLAGSFTVEPEFVEWEGTRYRVDLSTPEATRLQRLLGDEPRAFVSSARALVRLADMLGNASGSADRLRAAAEELAAVREALGEPLQDGAARAFRETADSLQRAVRAADIRRAARLAPALRVLADDLLARGLLELAYAAALGQPGAAAISASEAAERHDFGRASRAHQSAWQLPEAGTRDRRGWHVRGSLLGLDVRLAHFSLMRISSRPPARAPSLNDVDRRVFTQVVNLVDPTALSETRRNAMVAALHRGRARLAAVQTPSDLLALADELRLSPVRRTLLTWAIAREPERVPLSFSLSEVLWLGAEASSPKGLFDPWGAPGEPRLGCLCLRLDRGSWEPLVGRWNSGIFASWFPDLNLRLAELLAELGMPAALLGPVLAAATVDFVENANTRDQGDRRSLIEFVRGIRRERVEEYLALLTTDGPLVPVGAAGPASYAGSLQ